MMARGYMLATQMHPIISAFWQIMVLRQGPEDLPDSRFLLGLAAGACLLVTVLGVVLLYPPQALVPLVIINMGVPVLWATSLLALFGLRGRTVRTLAALLGTAAILNVFALVFAGLPIQIRTIPLLLILLWSIAVDGHILARGLSRSFGIGVALAVVSFLITSSLSFQFNPAN